MGPQVAPPGVLLDRIRGEYREMPGLCLTLAQAQRLWGLNRSECESLLAALIEAGFLRRTRTGAYALRDSSSATEFDDRADWPAPTYARR